ncbi:MAG TPA: hypothetical protein VIK18_25705 [Pirellulales bacterium]
MHRNHHTESYGLVALVVAGLMACLVAFMLPDVKRYLRLKRM